jgi:hypothetical protein
MLRLPRLPVFFDATSIVGCNPAIPTRLAVVPLPHNRREDFPPPAGNNKISGLNIMVKAQIMFASSPLADVPRTLPTKTSSSGDAVPTDEQSGAAFLASCASKVFRGTSKRVRGSALQRYPVQVLELYRHDAGIWDQGTLLSMAGSESRARRRSS